MTRRNTAALAAVALVTAAMRPASAPNRKNSPKVKIPEAGVPQIMTLEGQYIESAVHTTKATPSSGTASPTRPSARTGCCSRSD